MSRKPFRRRIAAASALLLAAQALNAHAYDAQAGNAPVQGAELLVGNKSADTLWRLSLADGRKLGETPTAPGPHEIAVSPDGQLAVVSEYGRQAPGNTLGVYDTADGRLLRRIDLGTHTRPHGMRFDADSRRLLVTTEGSDALLVVDVEGKVERAIDLGPGKGHMVALSRDGAVAMSARSAPAPWCASAWPTAACWRSRPAWGPKESRSPPTAACGSATARKVR